MAKILDITEKQKRDIRQFNFQEEDQSEFDKGVMELGRKKLFEMDRKLMDAVLKKPHS